jgi:hypothetical protein
MGPRVGLDTVKKKKFLHYRELNSIISQNFMESEDSLPCSKQLSTLPLLSQMNPVHATLSYICHIHFNIILYLRLDLPSGLFYCFPFLSNPYPAHLILLDFYYY